MGPMASPTGSLVRLANILNPGKTFHSLCGKRSSKIADTKFRHQVEYRCLLRRTGQRSMVTIEDFIATGSRASSLEPLRAQLYGRALQLIQSDFEVEAYVLILATWNFARFRCVMRSFDLHLFTRTVSDLAPIFDRLKDQHIVQPTSMHWHQMSRRYIKSSDRLLSRPARRKSCTSSSRCFSSCGIRQSGPTITFPQRVLRTTI
jgi:hypothetical protein